MANTVVINRENWRDVDWAKYLNCPVDKIAEYRKILSQEYDTGIAKVFATGKYRFEFYRYETLPDGIKRPLLQYSSKEEFNNFEEARKYANEKIISADYFYLKDFWAKILGVPAKAIQMLLIKQK